MKTTLLECRKCELSGGLGLVPASMPRFDEASAMQDGVGVAHDIIEHVNGVEEIGGVGDELEALGAIWFTRGALADIRRDGVGSAASPVGHLAADIRMNFDYWRQHSWSKPIPTQAAVDEFEQDMRDILQQGINETIAEYDYDLEYAELLELRGQLAEFIVGARHFMRVGYLKQQKHYGSKTAANRQFWAVAEAVQDYATGCEYEGQQYELTYGDGEAHCSEYYEHDEELSCDDCGDYFEDEGTHRTNPNGYTQCGDCYEKEQAA